MNNPDGVMVGGGRYGGPEQTLMGYPALGAPPMGAPPMGAPPMGAPPMSPPPYGN